VGNYILYTLFYVDNQTATAEDKDDLSYMIRKLQEAYEQRGLIINKKKSEHMILGNNEKENLPLEDYINGVDTCKCVGVISVKTVRVTKK
jgi:hypothetical protein